MFENIKDVPVLTLDCNQEFEDNPENMKKHLEKLHEFFQINAVRAPSGETSKMPGINKAFGHNKVA